MGIGDMSTIGYAAQRYLDGLTGIGFDIAARLAPGIAEAEVYRQLAYRGAARVGRDSRLVRLEERLPRRRTLCPRAPECNRLSRLLYNDDKSPRKEKAAQLAFFGIANAYCEANNFDISPEADGGAGPVDFKISKGYEYRVVVEMKLSSNSNL